MDAPYSLKPDAEITLRRATPEDAEAIAELSGQLDYPLPADVVRQRIAHLNALAEHAIFVAEFKSRVVGWVHAYNQQSIVLGQRGEILGLVVSSDIRKRGIGRLLMGEAERWLRDRGLDMVVLRSNVQRPESHAFYPAVGYQHFKTQAAYRKPALRTLELQVKRLGSEIDDAVVTLQDFGPEQARDRR